MELGLAGLREPLYVFEQDYSQGARRRRDCQEGGRETGRPQSGSLLWERRAALTGEAPKELRWMFLWRCHGDKNQGQLC